MTQPAPDVRAHSQRSVPATPRPAGTLSDGLGELLFTTPGSVLALQRAIGNQATGQLLNAPAPVIGPRPPGGVQNVASLAGALKQAPRTLPRPEAGPRPTLASPGLKLPD